MRVVILDTYYPAFQRAALSTGRVDPTAPYASQRQQWLDQAFGTSDFYSRNLRTIGHDAQDLIGNCLPLQLQWAREFAPRLAAGLGWARLTRRTHAWFQRVVLEQVRQLAPDVLYVQDLTWLAPPLLNELKRHARLIVGQTACALPEGADYRGYDLIFSSFPHYVQRFRDQGIASEYLRIAFDPVVLDRLGSVSPHYGLTFVGGFSPSVYPAGTRIFDDLARRVRVDFWGYGVAALGPRSAIRATYHGEAWAMDMYRVLAQSRIVLNRHGWIAQNYANNMRMFEVTGVGALLLTDARDNLGELFDLTREVVPYSSAEECVELATYYLEHEAERAAIAAAGQQRTLREHTYLLRMHEIVEHLSRRLAAPSGR